MSGVAGYELPLTHFCVVAAVAALSGTTMLLARENTASLSPAILREIARVETEIDRIEAERLKCLAAPPDNQVQRIELLGKLLLSTRGCLSTETRPALSAIC